MIDVGIMPSIQNCNRVLKVLRDSDRIEQAREIYRQMLDSGIFPSIVTFNTMLDTF